MHRVPTVSELVPFNHLPIEGVNDTLELVNGSGVSQKGIIPILVMISIYKAWSSLAEQSSVN